MVIDRIFQQARERPRDVAFVDSGTMVSYADFATAIAMLADFFRAQGVKAGAVGVICIDSLLDLWLALLALRSCGVVTLAARTPEIAGDHRLGPDGYVVTTAAQPQPTAAALAQRNGWREIVVPASLPAQARPALIAPSNPEGGHLLLTSGTTGRYKPIYRPPESHSAREARHTGALGIGKRTWQYLGAMGPWTGGAYGRALTVWTHGGACVFEQRAGRVADFLKLPVTDAKLTVSDMAELLAKLPPRAPRRDDLRIQIVGGAAPWVLVEQIRARITKRIYNNLSSTEASTIASSYLEKPGDQYWYTIYPERVVEVVDENDQPVPAGVIGRLRIKMLADDRPLYWGDEDASKEFFKDDFWYSGDLALFGPDGRLSLQGRTTDVISVRGGDKIPAAPIEQDVQTALGISGACLFATPNAATGVDNFHLALETAAPLDETARKTALAKVPLRNVHIHVMATLPRNAMGKIDRLALRQRFGLFASE